MLADFHSEFLPLCLVWTSPVTLLGFWTLTHLSRMWVNGLALTSWGSLCRYWKVAIRSWPHQVAEFQIWIFFFYLGCKTGHSIPDRVKQGQTWFISMNLCWLFPISFHLSVKKWRGERRDRHKITFFKIERSIKRTIFKLSFHIQWK